MERVAMNFLRQILRGQTFVFFLASFSTVFLLCGLGLDAGLWYLDRTRLSRACDSSVITGAANFGLTSGTNSVSGMLQVATKMRNVAVANYYGLKDIATAPVQATTLNNLGGNNYHFYYTTAGDTNQAGYHVTINTGLKGQVTLARADAWSKTRTSFMGLSGISQLINLNTTGSAEAQRRPRLIVIVLDRSGSMIGNGGATNLPKAVTNFLGMMKEDAENNQVGIVSFSSFGRVEMYPTSAFWTNGTNKMYGAEPTGTDYGTSASLSKVNSKGLNFGGGTAADEGMRLALEIMRTNQGFTDPQTFKFIVFFTDGAFNCTRTMLAAPGWTNTFSVTNTATQYSSAQTNYLPISPFGGGDDTAISKATDVATNGRTYGIKAGSKSGTPPKYYNTVVVTNQPGSMTVYYRNSGGAITNWSQNKTTTSSYTLQGGESVSLIVPGYVLDGVLIYGGTNGYSYTPSYFSENGYSITKPDDLGEDLGYQYPYGIGYAIENYKPSGSELFGAKTNLLMSDPIPAGELFYNCVNGTTQEMINVNEWLRNLPFFATNYFSAAMMTNTSAKGNSRYFPASYRGIAKPASWYMDGGTVRTTNMTPGGITNLPSGTTNINSMALSSGPTHYYDFRVGAWSNFSSWNDPNGANLMVRFCNWKVMTYCNMARKSDVLVYTVGFKDADSNVLRAMANDRNATNYNSSAPTGRFYACNKPQDITTNFAQIAQQILAFLSR